VIGVCVPVMYPEPSAATAPATRQAGAVFVDPIQLERAHGRLVQVSATLDREVPLAELLRLMLPRDGDETLRPAEYRAALVAVAFYMNQWPLTIVASRADDWPRATPRRITLAGRRDLARHFVVSAAMAATVGSTLADAVALFKEMLDGQGRSGFSFSDVAANRAGQRFGTLAAGSAASAATLASRLASPLADDQIMPDTAGLPDGLTDQEFQRRYGAVGSAEYSQLIEEIDSRLSALPLYRQQ